MSLLVLVKLSYFVAATLFLLGLKRMASPKTARSGIQWAGAGMLIATLATFFLPNLHNIGLMIAAIAIGVGANWAWGKPESAARNSQRWFSGLRELIGFGAAVVNSTV